MLKGLSPMKLRLFPYLRYKYLSIYVNEKGGLIVVSNGRSKKLGIVEIDYINELLPGFSDDKLHEKLSDSFQKCYSIRAQDNVDNNTVIGRYMGFKTYSRAVKGLKLVAVSWKHKEGYEIVPTEKKKGHGYRHLEEFKIKADDNTLVEAVRSGIKRASILSE